MENRAHALVAGLFSLVLAAALVAAGLWFRKDDIRLARYVVSTTSSVAGLKVEAPVQYRGVHVGRVESIKIEPGVSGRINVRIGVQEDTPVTKSTYAQLGYQGVTGLAYVSLNDDGSSSELLKAAGGEPPRIGLRPSVFDSGLDMVATVGELAEHLRSGAKDFPLLVGDARSRPRAQRPGRESAELRIRRPAQKTRTGRAGIHGRRTLKRWNGRPLESSRSRSASPAPRAASLRPRRRPSRITILVRRRTGIGRKARARRCSST